MKNRFLLSLSFAVACLPLFGQTSFTGLNKSITECENELVTLIEPLEAEQQVLALHFFAPLSPEANNALGENLGALITENGFINELMVKLIQVIIPKVMEKYTAGIEAKFLKNNPNPTEEQENAFYEKQQEKVFELLAYMNGRFYKTLYNYIAENNSDKLLVMFDENGLISAENRTEALPQPE